MNHKSDNKYVNSVMAAIIADTITPGIYCNGLLLNDIYHSHDNYGMDAEIYKKLNDYRSEYLRLMKCFNKSLFLIHDILSEDMFIQKFKTGQSNTPIYVISVYDFMDDKKMAELAGHLDSADVSEIRVATEIENGTRENTFVVPDKPKDRLQMKEILIGIYKRYSGDNNAKQCILLKHKVDQLRDQTIAFLKDNYQN